MKRILIFLMIIGALIMGYVVMDVAKSILKTNLSNPSVLYDDSLTETEKMQKLQQVYKKAPEYHYIGLAYYEDGFSEEGVLRDAYIPYEENYVQRDVYSVYGYAHGVGVRQHMKQSTTAIEANKLLVDEFVDKIKNSYGSTPIMISSKTFDNDTIAVTIMNYLDDQKRPVDVFLYTDIRDNGKAYLCAEITVTPLAFDDKSNELLKEMDDIFGLTVSKMYETEHTSN